MLPQKLIRPRLANMEGRFGRERNIIKNRMGSAERRRGFQKWAIMLLPSTLAHQRIQYFRLREAMEGNG